MEEEDQEELQLLPTSLSNIASSSQMLSSQASDHSSLSRRYRSMMTTVTSDQSSLDLQLSISLRPIHHRPSNRVISSAPICDYNCVESLKWQAAEQIRLAAKEKAYAERVRDLTKREMEMAQSEFARAKNVWKRAKEDVEKAEKMKERATLHIDSTCMEITCQSCSQRFRP